MYAVSTAAFMSILALASSLAVVVQGGGPRITKCLVTEPISKQTSCNELFRVVTPALLARLNPGQDCLQVIASGEICVQGQFPICKTNVTAGATDTNCDKLVTANGITKAQFIAYNDDVNPNDCSGVVDGQKYCVAVFG